MLAAIALCYFGGRLHWTLVATTHQSDMRKTMTYGYAYSVLAIWPFCRTFYCDGVSMMEMSLFWSKRSNGDRPLRAHKGQLGRCWERSPLRQKCRRWSGSGDPVIFGWKGTYTRSTSGCTGLASPLFNIDANVEQIDGPWENGYRRVLKNSFGFGIARRHGTGRPCPSCSGPLGRLHGGLAPFVIGTIRMSVCKAHKNV